jgi:hypothetical protein
MPLRSKEKRKGRMRLREEEKKRRREERRGGAHTGKEKTSLFAALRSVYVHCRVYCWKSGVYEGCISLGKGVFCLLSSTSSTTEEVAEFRGLDCIDCHFAVAE